MIQMLLFLLVQTACSHAYQVSMSHDTEVHTFRRDYANVHLVKTGLNSYLMIDSGSWAEAPHLVDEIREKGIELSWIKGIILTHGHWDHASGAKYFQDKFSIPIFAGAGDRRILAQGHSDPLCSTSLIARILEGTNKKTQFDPPQVTTWIDQPTDLAALLGVSGKIILIPTHTEGSLVVILGTAAFMGDLVRGSIIGSEAETHFYLCDVKGNQEAVQLFLQKEGRDVQDFFPGHFGPRLTRQTMVEHFDGVSSR